MSRAVGGFDRPVPAFRQLCVIAHYTLDRIGDSAEASDAVDAMKWACAKARLDYGTTGVLYRALDAVVVARKKGYRTPRLAHRSDRSGPDVWVAPPAFTRDELARAEAWRRNVGRVSGCPHTPECDGWEQCRAALIRGWRRARRCR